MKDQTVITLEKETAMPTESDAVKVAVMNNELKNLNTTMIRVEGKFDDAIKNFASNERVDALKQAADAKHKEQDQAIKKLEDWNTWFMRTAGALLIAAVIGGVLITK
jgi:hypothetical protein